MGQSFGVHWNLNKQIEQNENTIQQYHCYSRNKANSEVDIEDNVVP